MKYDLLIQSSLNMEWQCLFKLMSDDCESDPVSLS